MIMDLNTAISNVGSTGLSYKDAVGKTTTDTATVDSIQRQLNTAQDVVSDDKAVVSTQALAYTAALGDLRDSAQAIIDQLAGTGTVPPTLR